MSIVFLFSGLSVFNNPGYVIARAATETTRLPVTTYTCISGNLVTYTTSSLHKRSGYICSNDLCKVTRIYGANSSCQVQYPIASGTKTAYESMDDFFQNVSFSTSTKKIGKKLAVYHKSSGYATIGTVYSTDYVTIIGTENRRTQIMYPISGGYKMGYIIWILIIQIWLQILQKKLSLVILHQEFIIVLIINGVNYTNQHLSARRVAALDKAKQMCTIA